MFALYILRQGEYAVNTAPLWFFIMIGVLLRALINDEKIIKISTVIYFRRHAYCSNYVIENKPGAGYEP